MRRLLLTLPLVLAAQTAGAVIDCSHARSHVDRLICSNDSLAAAEERMAYAFRAAARRGIDPGELRRSQGEWNVNVRDLCNDVPCLLKVFDDRSAELDNL